MLKKIFVTLLVAVFIYCGYVLLNWPTDGRTLIQSLRALEMYAVNHVAVAALCFIALAALASQPIKVITEETRLKNIEKFVIHNRSFLNDMANKHAQVPELVRSLISMGASTEVLLKPKTGFGDEIKELQARYADVNGKLKTLSKDADGNNLLRTGEELAKSIENLQSALGQVEAHAAALPQLQAKLADAATRIEALEHRKTGIFAALETTRDQADELLTKDGGEGRIYDLLQGDPSEDGDLKEQVASLKEQIADIGEQMESLAQLMTEFDKARASLVAHAAKASKAPLHVAAS